MKIALAEHFHSIQGEGEWTGTPMHFVRVAGCSVGKPLAPVLTRPLSTGAHPWQCCTYDDRPFLCDTDFHKKEEVEIERLLGETWEEAICLTGGEPLMPAHRSAVIELIRLACEKEVRIHIETSGCEMFGELLKGELIGVRSLWLTVAPKQGFLTSMIRLADEVKLLVDKDFDPTKIPLVILEHGKIFLSPVNDDLTISRENLEKTLEILKHKPSWRLSVQLHKYLGMR